MLQVACVAGVNGAGVCCRVQADFNQFDVGTGVQSTSLVPSYYKLDHEGHQRGETQHRIQRNLWSQLEELENVDNLALLFHNH